MNSVNTGLQAPDRERVANQLKRLMADSYTLYLQSHNFHWNVTGLRFRELHLMFEEHYTELATAIDDIAERIRALGYAAPGTYLALSELSSIEEIQGVPSADDMVETLKASHESLVNTCREALIPAQEALDESSCALISDRMRTHEKTAWMLRALQA